MLFSLFIDLFCITIFKFNSMTQFQLVRKVLHGAVGRPRGWFVMCYNGKQKFVFWNKRSKEVKNSFLFFIDVKLDFMWFAHHFDAFCFSIFRPLFFRREQKPRKNAFRTAKRMFAFFYRMRFLCDLAQFVFPILCIIHRNCRIDVTKT